MATTTCLKCLSRPSAPCLLSNSFTRLSIASFSTSGRKQAVPPKAKPGVKKEATKGTKTLRIKKKAPAKPAGKPPASGERKAARKRVVLSNTNALEVEGMRDLDSNMLKEMTEDPAAQEATGEAEEKQLATAEEGGVGKRELVGQVVGLKGETMDSLRAVEAFKATQGWGLFRRPGLLVREETVVLTRKLVTAEKQKGMIRMVIDGDRGTGKSLMLIHAMATAFVRGWIVLNIPEGKRCCQKL